MGKIRRKFDVQFKIQVCQRIEAGIQTVAEISRDNQVQRAIIDGWMQRYVAGTLQAKTSDREKEQEREIEKLKAKIGELTMTIDLLKKVEAFKKQLRNEDSLIYTSSNLAQFQKPAKPLALLPQPTTTSRKAR